MQIHYGKEFETADEIKKNIFVYSPENCEPPEKRVYVFTRKSGLHVKWCFDHFYHSELGKFMWNFVDAF